MGPSFAAWPLAAVWFAVVWFAVEAAVVESAARAEGTPVWVVGAGAWMAGVTDISQFRAGARPSGEASQEPAGAAIERRARRRATALSRAMADACAQAIQEAGESASEVPTVFGSALGEAPTMIALMDQMCRGEEMSPMRFATSVHSAASGVVSISNRNRAFTTSLSADYDTVAAALLEAAGLLLCGAESVVVVLGDDPSPVDFVPEEEGFERLAVALALRGREPAGGNKGLALGRVGLPSQGLDSTLAGAELPPRLARNPIVGGLDLISALLSRRSGTLRLDRGRGGGYAVEVQPTQ